MKTILKKIIVLIGVSFLGIGIANAASSSDCGDDDVQPINIHKATTAIITES